MIRGLFGPLVSPSNWGNAVLNIAGLGTGAHPSKQVLFKGLCKRRAPLGRKADSEDLLLPVEIALAAHSILIKTQ